MNLAKFTEVKIENIYLRERLFTKLDRSRNFPIIWISAPAGSGKTTLIASYLQARKEQTLWYTVDSGDSDAATFFYYMKINIEGISDKSAKTLPLLTPEYIADLPTYSRNYFRQFFNYFNNPGFLVLDNYQELPADAILQRLLSDAFSETPRNVNVIIISRSNPVSTFARLRINRMLTVIDWDEIRFTLEETKEFLSKKINNRKIAALDYDQLYKQSQGWIAAYVLIAEKECDWPISDYLTEHLDTLFEYFAGEIFKRLDNETRFFLLKTAVLPIIRADVAKDLTQVWDSEIKLKELVRRNYFTVLQDGYPLRFEYHPLFRQFLISRASDHFSSAYLLELKTTAADLLIQTEDIESAMTLLLSIGAYNKAATLINKYGDRYIEQGRSKTILTWISELPEKMLNTTPDLLYWFAQCHLYTEPVLSRRKFEHAYELFESNGELVGKLLTWCGIVDSFIYEFSDFKPLDLWISKMEGLLSENKELPSPDIEVKVSCGMFLSLMYRQAGNSNLLYWENKVLEIINSNIDLRIRMNIGTHLLLYYTWWRSDLSKAEIVANTLEQFATSDDVPPIVQTSWKFILACFQWVTADNEATINTATEGLAIADKSAVHIWDNVICVQAVIAALSAGQVDRAEPFLERMAKSLVPTRYTDIGAYYHVAAWKSLIDGNLIRAETYAKASLDAFEKSGISFYHAVGLDQWARMLFLTGEKETARIILKKAIETGRTFNSSIIEFLTLLTETEFYLLENNIPGCVDSLRRFLIVARTHRYRANTWWRPEMMSRLYALALKYCIETDYVQWMIRHWELPPPNTATSELENWPWSVRISAFGTLEVTINDKTLETTGKAQHRTLDLLAAITSLGGKNIPATKIADALWPDADADVAHHALESGLYRLRKVLGKKSVIYSSGKVGLNPNYCWLDVWSFLGLAAQYDVCALSADNYAESNVILQKILKIYKDHLLIDNSSAWSIDMRERCKKRMLRILQTGAAFEERAGNWQEAQTLLYQAIDLDPLAENLYRRLMVCYQNLGLKAKALVVYRDCQRIINLNLGISLSKETESIAQNLRE